MSVPNTSNDPQAPLLTGEHQDGIDDETSAPTRTKTVTIFKRTFNVLHLIILAVSTLALIAIGVSIAAIGTTVFLHSNQSNKSQFSPSNIVVMIQTPSMDINITPNVVSA